MVAIIGGPGLGLIRSSAFNYGQAWQLGSAAQGRGGESVYVNAVTGYLTLEDVDEILLGVGTDEQAVRSYSSAVPSNNPNVFAYSPSGFLFSDQRRVFLETGSIGVAGSVVRRLAPDGSDIAYAWDGAFVTVGGVTGAYVALEGEGGYDTITHSGGTFTWTDGATLATETFASANNGRITTALDKDGRGLTWAYDGLGRVSTITSSNGEVVTYDYTNAPSSVLVKATAGGQLRTRTRYAYDSLGRLSSVTVDLSPGDNAIADGASYVTTYGYQGTTTRVNIITQSDGSQVEFAYNQIGADQRVTQIAQTVAGTVRNTYLSYNLGTRTTTITDPLNQVTTVVYDSAGRIVDITTPPPVAGAAALVSHYSYDSKGDVQTITRADGGVTTFSYDAHGNRFKEVDSLGDTVERSFDGKNRLLSETRYLTPAQGANPPANPVVERYAYDSASNRRFTVSAEGRVTEYRYDTTAQPTSWGQPTAIIEYAAALYSGAITEAALSAWTAGKYDGAQRTDISYDARGNVSITRTFEKLVLATGAGDTTGLGTITNFTYDQSGKLLSRQITGGGQESYSYDGLWRIKTSSDADGAITVAYTDSARQTVVTTAATGLVETSVYDQAGALTSQTRAAPSGSPVLAAVTTTYKYDAGGRLRLATDGSGVRTFYLYDALDRKIAEVRDTGQMTEYVYDKLGHVVQTLGYRQSVSAAGIASLLDANGNPTNVTLASIRPVYDTGDHVEFRIYDGEGRLIESITEPQAYGAVVVYAYDGASRLVSETHYANEIDRPIIANLKTAPPTALVLPTPLDPANDRTTRYIYDKDDRLVGVIDGEGYLTETVYDGAGRKTQTIRYNNAPTTTTGTLAQIKTGLATHVDDIHNWWVYDGRGLLYAEIDGEGDLTRYERAGVSGAVSKQIRGEKLSLASLLATAPTYANLPAIPAADGGLEVIESFYDGFGRVTLELRHLTGLADEATSYTYDAVGRLLRTTVQNRVTASGALETRGSYRELDAFGRVTREISGAGAAALDANPGQANTMWGAYGTRYQYDAAGRVIARFDPDGTSANGWRTLLYYDSAGRLVYTIDALGHVTETRWDRFDEITTVIEYGNRISQSTLAGLGGGFASAVNTLVAGLANTAFDAKTIKVYDLDGSVTDMYDPNGNRWAYAYNAFGEQRAEALPLTSGTVVHSRSFDRRGLVKTDAMEGGADGTATTRFLYDAFGRVIRETSPADRYKTYAYDHAGRVLSVSEYSAANVLIRSRSYSYDNLGRVFTITDEAGYVTGFSYDRFSRTVTVTLPGGLTTTTLNNAFGQQVKLTDANTKSTSYDYDLDGHLIRVTDGAGNITQASYYYAGRLQEATDASGVKTRFAYDAEGRVIWRWVDPNNLNLTTQYDFSNPLLMRIIDPAGVVTDITYDLDGNQKTVVVDSQGSNPLTTTYGYDPQGHVVSETISDTHGVARTTTYQYDNLGRLKHKEIPGPSGVLTSTDYAWDLDGNLIAETDGAGKRTRYVYDGVGRLAWTVDAEGDVTQTSYLTYQTSGQPDGKATVVRRYAGRVSAATLASWPSQVTEAQITAAVAASAGDEISVQAFDGAGRLRYALDAARALVEYLYDPAGNVIRRVEYAQPAAAADYRLSTLQGLATSNAANRIHRYVYDGAGREAWCIDAEGAVTATVYDGADKVTKQVLYSAKYTASDDPSLGYMSATWAPSNAASANDRVTRFIYDGAGRLGYQVDAEGYVTGNTYSAAGRLSQERRYAGVYAVADGATMTSMAALLANTPSDATVRTFSYDGAGRLITTSLDIGNGQNIATYFTRDAVGNVTDETAGYGTADAATTHNVYDAAGRLLQQTKAYGTADATTTRWLYDGVGRVTATMGGIGSAALAADPDQSAAHVWNVFRAYGTTYAYDAVGRTTQVSTSLGDVNGVSTYAVTTNQYDAFGNLVKVIDPRGNAGYFYYDKLDRLTLQVDPEGYVTETGYTIGGEVSKVIRRATPVDTTSLTTTAPPLVSGSTSDAYTDFTYDRLGRLTSVIDAEGHGANGVLLSGQALADHTESYVLNAFGERWQVTGKLGGVTTNAYDRRGLLTSETFAGMTVSASDGSTVATSVINTYEYDGRGNRRFVREAYGRTEQRNTEYLYDKADRLIEKRGDAVTAYAAFDSASGTSATPSESYAYDARGDLVRQTDANGAATLFFYDRQGRKTAQLTRFDAAGMGYASPVGVLQAFGYDLNGNLTSEKTYGDLVAMPSTAGGSAPPPVNAGNVRTTLYAYDRNNRLVSKKVQGLLITRQDISAGPLVQTNQDVEVKSEYDYAGNLIKQTDGRGYSVYTVYDKLGRKRAQVDQLGYLTAWTLDQDGNVSSETRYAQALTIAVSTSTTLAQLLASAASSADDRTTTFTYDRNGRRITETRLNVEAWKVDDTSGLQYVTQNTPKVSTEIRYDYNGLGQVIKRTEATGDWTSFNYDAFGRLTSTVSSPVTIELQGAPTSAQHAVTSFYDGLGDVVRVEDTRVGAPAAEARVTTYAYGAGGRLSAMTDAASFQRSYAYDTGGRLVRESWTRTQGDTTQVTEAKGYRYDAAGRTVLQVSLAWANAQWTQGDDQTLYRFNAWGELTGRGLNGSYQETFDYDAGGRMWRTNAGDGVVRLYAYDAAGNQTLEIASAGKNLAGFTMVANGNANTDALAYLTEGVSTYENSIKTDVAATVQVYDARGQVTETRALARELAAGQAPVKIITQKTYNAFGETASETDFNPSSSNNAANTTNYTYNTQGRLILKQAPNVNTVSETGATQNIRPTETYYYDVSGRLLGTKDANDHVNYRKLQGGTGYGGSQAVALKETHADGGAVNYGLDVWGEVVRRTNEIGKVTLNAYDKMGRLTQVTHAPVSGASLVDYYGFDGLGQRTWHFDSVHGSGIKEKTNYDRQGRVVDHWDYAGWNTHYDYVWDATTATMGQIFGGVTRTTRNTSNLSSIDQADYFGRSYMHRDFGGHYLYSTYDKGGRLTGQADAGTGASYTQTLGWFNTGKLRSATTSTFTNRTSIGFNQFVENQTIAMSATYAYDRNGNRVAETLTRQGVSLESATATYDAMNRLTRFMDSGQAGHSADVSYAYDKAGNLRHVAATYTDINGTANAQKDYWYTYDLMDRIAITKGTRDQQTGVIGIGAEGLLLSYDQAGRRHDATSAGGHVETYDYSDDDYLTGVTITDSGATTSTAYTRRDLLGRTLEYTEQKLVSGALTTSYHRRGISSLDISYDLNSLILQERVETLIDGQGMQYVDNNYYYKDIGTPPTSWDPRSNTYTYDGQYTGGQVTHMTSVINAPNASQYTNQTYSQYIWVDGAMQYRTWLLDASNPNATPSLTNTEDEYDAAWHLTSAHIGGGPGGGRDVAFVDDMMGHVLSRTEYPSTGQAKHHFYYYLNGIEVGDIDDTGSTDVDYAAAIARRGQPSSSPSGAAADFDANYVPVGPSLSTTDGSYTVRDGETLRTIAAELWGDASLWWLVAQANGLNGSEPLVSGARLVIPNKVANLHHNASTFEVYDPSKAVGDLQPEPLVPPPPTAKKKGGGLCGTIAKVFAVIIAVVVIAVLKLPVQHLFSNLFGVGSATATANAAALYANLGLLPASVATSAAGAAAAATSAAAIAAGVTLGAIGSIVSQGFSVAVGIQDKFSWKGVALGAIAGGVNAGLSGTFSKVASSTLLGNAVRGGVSNAVTQGIAVATGLQDRFDWTGVAAAAIVSGTSSAADKWLSGKVGWTGATRDIVVNGGAGLASAAAGAATRSALMGTNFGDNVMAVLPDVIGSTIGNAVGGSIAKGLEVKRLMGDQARAILGPGADPKAFKAVRNDLLDAYRHGRGWTPAQLRAKTEAFLAHQGTPAEQIAASLGQLQDAGLLSDNPGRPSPDDLQVLGERTPAGARVQFRQSDGTLASVSNGVADVMMKTGQLTETAGRELAKHPYLAVTLKGAGFILDAAAGPEAFVVRQVVSAAVGKLDELAAEGIATQFQKAGYNDDQAYLGGLGGVTLGSLLVSGASSAVGIVKMFAGGGAVKLAAFVAAAKRGPKTDPSAPHNAKIRAEADILEAQGNRVIAGGGRAPERLIPTPGGHKSGRRPDILYETKEEIVKGRNVGLSTSKGNPVAREQRALDDLNGAGVETDFAPYDR